MISSLSTTTEWKLAFSDANNANKNWKPCENYSLISCHKIGNIFVHKFHAEEITT